MNRLGSIARRVALLVAVTLLACAPERPSASDGSLEHRVLLVANRNSAVSVRLADAYQRARGVLPSHRVLLTCPTTEEIDRETYRATIRRPLVDFWQVCPDSLRPDFVVLMKGIPHKIRGTEGVDGDQASVDSELAFVPEVAAGLVEGSLRGGRRNLYLAVPGGEVPPFRSRTYGMLLVTRIDGFTEADARALLDRSLRADSLRSDEVRSEAALSEDPPKLPTIVLDLRGSHEDDGERWLRQTAERIETTAAGRVHVLLEDGPLFVVEATDVVGYASWGSNDPAAVRGLRFEWLPGGLATTYVSTSARTFDEPPATWAPGRWKDQDAHWRGSPQSLIGDIVREGATGVSGNAYEPYLHGCVRPDLLFPAWFSGRNLAESFYAAMPLLSWQGVVLGDPLCRRYVPAPETRFDERP